LPKRVWQKDGDSLQDSISAYSEMPGGLSENEQLRRAMKAPVDLEKLRKHL